ncbi:alpha/beta hydrolase [Salinibacterium sp. PAMC 21357]|uniref:alpha/beta hydrolase n=1 Tax=Salinibacterium sp. PAMC 21357 TaxID=1112215 RepID=UPI000289EE07|nr:alpha/beta hydrolase [Salinibacterium sp. PAMC 21357]
MHAAESNPSEPSSPRAPASRPTLLSRRGRIVRVLLISLASLIVFAAIGILVWANVGVMQAEPDPLEKVSANPAVSLHETPDSFILSPTDGASGVGLVFIPGAKVNAEAYLYKLSGAVVESGLTVVVTKPILNLAFFDQRPLTTFTDTAPDIDSWFVGGHSLGGVRACQYAAQPDVSGLVLFASYCANDLADVGTRVLSLSGSNDLLSTPDKIMNAAHLLPTNTTFFPIDGANHARFGDYGVQSGDGVADLDSSVVRDVITAEIDSFVRNG